MQSDMSEHASTLIGHERDARSGGCDARRELKRKVHQGLDPDICRIAPHIGRTGNDTDNGDVPHRRCVAEHGQLVAERMLHGSIDAMVDGTQGRPQGVYAQLLVEVGRVVQRDSLEALLICGKPIEFGEVPTALFFHADLDLADPATLEFDPLCDGFLLQDGGDDQHDSATADGREAHRSLVMSLWVRNSCSSFSRYALAKRVCSS